MLAMMMMMLICGVLAQAPHVGTDGSCPGRMHGTSHASSARGASFGAPAAGSRGVEPLRRARV